MAGERPIRISVEAREELSRAVQQIDTALDRLKTTLATISGQMQVSDASAERLEESIEDVGQEATQATISLSGLMAMLSGLEASAGTRGVDIPIDIDDPDATTLEEVRSKVAAQLRANPAEFDIGADIDTDELAREIEEADAWINQHTKRGARRPLANMGVDLDEASMVKELELAQKEAEAAAGDVDMGLDVPEEQVFSATGRVGQATEQIEDTAANNIELQLTGPSSGQIFSATGRVGKATSAIEATGANNIDIEFNVADEVLELFALASSLSAVQAQAIAATASTRGAASGIDEMGDEATESATEMTVLQSVMSLMSLNTTALSLNVGAFNIALANLATQIPILIGLLGTLATVLAGVAGAALLAGTAFAGIVAGGFVAELDRVAEQFENIENRAEAMQAIMQSLVDVFIEAFEPLIEAGEEANAFFGVINSLLETINVFAKGIADSMEFSRRQMEEFIAVGEGLGIIDDEMSSAEIDDRIMSLGEFFDELGRIWQNNVEDIIVATQIMSAFLLPILADIIKFFIAGFDDMVLFITQFTEELTAIGPALQGLIDFAVQLVDLASVILQGLIPVMVGVLSIATAVADAFNSLEAQFVRNIAAFGLLALLVGKTVKAMGSLFAAMKLVTAGTALQSGMMVQARLAALAYTGQISALTGAKASLNMITWNLSSGLKSMTASLWTLVPSTGAATGATFSLAGAYAVLSAVTGGLLTALPAIAAALIAITGVAAGAIAVFASSDSVISGLGETFGMLKQAIAAIVDILLGSLIRIANSMITIFMSLMSVVDALNSGLTRIGEALGLVSDDTSMLGAFIEGLMIGIKLLLAPIELLWSMLAKLSQILATTLTASIGLVVDLIMVMVSIWKSLFNIIGMVVNKFLQWTGLSGIVGEAIGFIVGAVQSLIDALMSLPEIASSVFNMFMEFVENMINGIIDAINSIIETANKIPGVDISTFGEVSLTGTPGEEGDITREDVVGGDGEDAEDAFEQIEGQQATEINYNEENVNEVAQEINADPEDKESLKRVIKDAMEEANAFTRQTQGGM